MPFVLMVHSQEQHGSPSNGEKGRVMYPTDFRHISQLKDIIKSVLHERVNSGQNCTMKSLLSVSSTLY